MIEVLTIQNHFINSIEIDSEVSKNIEKDNSIYVK